MNRSVILALLIQVVLLPSFALAEEPISPPEAEAETETAAASETSEPAPASTPTEAADDDDSAVPGAATTADDDDSAAAAGAAAADDGDSPAAAGATAADDGDSAIQAPPPARSTWDAIKSSGSEFLPILILLIVIGLAVGRLPKIEGLGHSDSYRSRRIMNWLPLGLTYAFLYMGRYNLTVSKSEFGKMGLMDNADFGTIFGIGTLVYGCAFLINGPITDRWGGRRAILIGAAGALVMNLLMGLVAYEVYHSVHTDKLEVYTPGAITNAISAIAAPIFGAFTWFRGLFGVESGSTETWTLLPALSLLYAGNMYFQSFGAVAIVKVNAPWFHVRERGVFGAIFGILISLGVYFAYDWNGLILKIFGPDPELFPNLPAPAHLVFFVPAALLAIFWVIVTFVVRNRPSEAGFEDFHTGDATAGDDSPPDPPLQVFKRMLTNPIILTIAGIEFCSGFLRQAIMQWGKIFSKQVMVDANPDPEVTEMVVLASESFVSANWGMLLCCAGILGGIFAGTISDHVFQSRRGPVAAVLYGAMLVGGIGMYFLLDTDDYLLMWMLIFMSICVIGVHGMLSGTASMDFGGAKNAGIAVGIIDGFVYLGTAVMSFWYGWRLPKDGAAADAANWAEWPLWMLPVALVGFLLATRVWNAKPKSSK